MYDSIVSSVTVNQRVIPTPVKNIHVDDIRQKL